MLNPTLSREVGTVLESISGVCRQRNPAKVNTHTVPSTEYFPGSQILLPLREGESIYGWYAFQHLDNAHVHIGAPRFGRGVGVLEEPFHYNACSVV